MKPWVVNTMDLPRIPQCQYCGLKAHDADPWDDAPEGFYDVEGDCLCEVCAEEFE